MFAKKFLVYRYVAQSGPSLIQLYEFPFVCESPTAIGIALKLVSVVPRYPILWSSCFIVCFLPPTSCRLWAFAKGILPAHTPEDTIEMGNRAPSSLRHHSSERKPQGQFCAYLVQLMTPTGYSVSKFSSLRTLSISTPLHTPSIPSCIG